ncbi:MAG: SRPBCC domain-containing protein, partial [Litoreibacter sp.]|nr:SRPBCC domain-containing protein [Litoreibacter sp.]
IVGRDSHPQGKRAFPRRTPDFRMETYIRCTQDALWDALTDPEEEAKYHFVADKITIEGNTLTYYSPDGRVMLICTKTREEPKTLYSATFEPKWDGPDMTHSRFDYLIEPQGEFCKLAIEHYDIPAGQEGVADGWHRMAAGLKTYLETGQPAKFGYGG